VGDRSRRKLAEGDFRFFCESYFPHLFSLAWSKDHLRVIGKIERVVRDHETLAVAMPRGSGKTTLCLTAVQWAVLCGHHRFVYLISSTQESALSLLATIKAHLGGPGAPLLLADFPEALVPIHRLEGETRRCNGQRYYGIPTRIGWGVDAITLPTIPASRSSGSIIRVAGITGNIRGALHALPDGRQVRPTLVVCDDPQTDQSAASILQTAERLGIINGAIRGLAGPGQRTAVIVPCTVIQSGDLADQLLDRKRNPSWHGERTKMLDAFPTNVKLWADYARLREQSLQADGDGREATEFYAAHRDRMDAGARAAWPERFLSDRGEISAVQHAMNLKLDHGEASFFAEYQNEPLRPGESPGEVLTVEQVCNRANGRPAGEVPLACTKLTMFVDVHDRLLYWCLCGWEENFAAGYVVDYGTWPHQHVRTFTLASAARTLGRAFPRIGADGAIQAGLEELVSTCLQREYKRGDGVMRIDRLLVDMGYKAGLVAAVKHKCGGTAMMLCRGMGIRASRQPMSTWKRRPGEQHGLYWYIPNVSRTAEHPHVAADVNWWKAYVHTALATAPGDRGCLTLFGKPVDHELLAAHVADSEQWTEVKALGRTVREWTLKPGRPDNHWLDCLTGCAVAASVAGLQMPGQGGPQRTRKHYGQADLTPGNRRN
jgi:hypothetical protein